VTDTPKGPVDRGVTSIRVCETVVSGVNYLKDRFIPCALIDGGLSHFQGYCGNQRKGRKERFDSLSNSDQVHLDMKRRIRELSKRIVSYCI
jgi:hypothetical protein